MKYYLVRLLIDLNLCILIPQLAVILDRRALPRSRWIGTRCYAGKTFIPSASICFINVGAAIWYLLVYKTRMPPQPFPPSAHIAQAVNLAAQFRQES